MFSASCVSRRRPYAYARQHWSPAVFFLEILLLSAFLSSLLSRLHWNCSFSATWRDGADLMSNPLHETRTRRSGSSLRMDRFHLTSRSLLVVCRVSNAETTTRMRLFAEALAVLKCITAFSAVWWHDRPAVFYGTKASTYCTAAQGIILIPLSI